MGNILSNKKLLCSDLIFRTENEIMEIMQEFVFPLNPIFKHRNIKYIIQFYAGNLKGYVDIQGKLPYKGHFGITGGILGTYQGFDCAHSGDLCLWHFQERCAYGICEGYTFKMPEFVHEECKKMIDAYLNGEICSDSDSD
uniref:Uncharacterized protein n=1 Tax=viral metagenome TaxID=1070528 RepID=A0A6C0AFR1_9ZZZZ